MATTVTMPQLGETVTEGTILRWAKQEGDTVAEDEVLLEISTDKVDTEVPSPAAGTVLEILVPEGETVSVGTPLVVIGDPGEKGDDATADEAPEEAEQPEEPEEESGEPEEPEEPTEEAGEESEVPEEPEESEEPEEEADEEPSAEAGEEPEEPKAAPAAAGDGQPLSPVVRRLAAENEVDLGEVSGTGREGRITRRDVEAHIARREEEPAEEPAPAAAAAEEEAPAPEPVAAPAAEDEEEAPVEEPAPEEEEPVEEEEEAPAPEPVAAPAAEDEGEAPVEEPAEEPAEAPAPVAPVPVPAARDDEVEEISRLRVRIAENMVRAKHSTAHVWTSVEVDYEAVEQVRQRHRDGFKEREGFSLTYLPFITRATVDALEAFPLVNSSFDLEGKRRIVHKRIDLGLSVDLDQEGLVVMTMRGADGLRLKGIAREVRRVAEKARSGDLEPDDIAGSTFTITNPGPFGSFLSAPIINVPNVAILSTETVVKRPVVVTDKRGNDAIAIRHVGYLGLTWDHRAFDGSTAVLFLRRIKENLETWDWEQELT